MHILTKFLVILAAILSILLSGLSIALTGNIDAVRNQFQSQKAAAAVANSAAAQAAATAAREREVFEQDLAAKNASLSQLQQSNNQLEGTTKQLQADNKRLQLSETSYAARIDQFTAIIDAQVQLGEARQKELETLRQKELESARKEIELADRINDLEGELEVAHETTRSLQEQLVDLRAEQAGGAQGTQGGAKEAQVLRAPQNLRARVTDVRPDADGRLLVSVDAGSSDLLKPKMKLNIVRNNEFIASIVLDKVDLNESVGRVVLTKDKSVVIQPGDLVIAAAL